MVGFFYPYGQFQDEHHETQIFGRFEMPKLMAERLKSCWISKNQVLRGAGMVSMHWAFQKCLGAQVAFTAWKGGTKQIPHLLEMVLLVVCSLRKIYIIKFIPNEKHKICEHLSEDNSDVVVSSFDEDT